MSYIVPLRKLLYKKLIKTYSTIYKYVVDKDSSKRQSKKLISLLIETIRIEMWLIAL